MQIAEIWKEPSTWRGLMYLATALGIQLNPEQIQNIVTAGMALAGAVGVLFSDKQKNGN